MNSPIQTALDHLPQSVQGASTAASLFTLLAAFLEKIHGPAATIGVILGAVWLFMQITNMAWNWFERIQKRRNKE